MWAIGGNAGRTSWTCGGPCQGPLSNTAREWGGAGPRLCSLEGPCTSWQGAGPRALGYLAAPYAELSALSPAASPTVALPGSLLEVGDGLLDSPQPLLQQTEDQLPSASYLDSVPFVSFSPPLDPEDYLWGLEEGEGVSDLFDTYDLGELLQN